MALEMFNSIDCAPNSATFVAALKACASLAVLEVGQRVHARIRELGLEQDEMVGSSLIDFYGKCGNMDAAERVFNRMRFKDIVSWNALIGGYSMLGNVSTVLSLVKRIQETRLQMDDITVLLILRACSHAGMVEEGQEYFESMSRYGVKPTMEHYTCMVDMLCRANRLQEAFLLVRRMPSEANSRIWVALLGSCKKWSDVEVAKVAFFALENHSNKEHVAAAYVLMRNFYERLGMQRRVTV